MSQLIIPLFRWWTGPIPSLENLSVFENPKIRFIIIIRYNVQMNPPAITQTTHHWKTHHSSSSLFISKEVNRVDAHLYEESEVLRCQFHEEYLPPNVKSIVYETNVERRFRHSLLADVKKLLHCASLRPTKLIGLKYFWIKGGRQGGYEDLIHNHITSHQSKDHISTRSRKYYHPYAIVKLPRWVEWIETTDNMNHHAQATRPWVNYNTKQKNPNNLSSRPSSLP